ncbi:hypothetical protein ACEPPN_002932 [Leptodophora sp. 'Broadleaf-Isolate-01']
MKSDTTASLALLRSNVSELLSYEALDLLQLSPDMPGSRKKPIPVVEIAGCILLEKIPLEICRKIYFYLVVSDKTSDLPRDRHSYRGSFKYGITPGLLGTCKKNYTEASEMLYRGNTFAMDCTVSTCSSMDTSQLGPNTLSRHPLPGGPEWPEWSYSSSVKDILAFENVQHWKAIVIPDSASIEMTAPEPQSLVVSTSCDDCLDNTDDRRAMWHIREQEKFRARRQVNLMVTLKPFEMFRGLDTFYVKCSVCDKSIDIEEGKIAKLKSLTESKEPIHHVFKTYEALLDYAQAFERIPLFRNNMASDRRDALPSVNHFNQRVIQNPKDLNPYMFSRVHPVEAALKLAKTAVDTNDYDKFKEHRLTILSFLEPQYNRMPVMSDEVVKLVEKQTKLDDHYGLHQYLYAKPQLELSTTTPKTFIRDSPGEIRVSLRRYGWIVKRLYAELPRERHLRDLQNAYDMKDFVNFHHIFSLAVRDMYGQWLNIRQARRKLMDFDWDSENTGCEIDLELWRDDSPLQLL